MIGKFVYYVENFNDGGLIEVFFSSPKTKRKFQRLMA